MNKDDLRHITIMDDPYDNNITEEQRANAQKWMDKTIRPRKNKDVPEIRILPMRLHEADEIGVITEDTDLFK